MHGAVFPRKKTRLLFSSPECQAFSAQRAGSLSGQRLQGREATAGTTSGVRSRWVAVYPCARGCLPGVLEAMK